MKMEPDIDYLRANLSLHIKEVVPAQRCGDMISRYDQASANGEAERVAEALIKECQAEVFTSDINTLLDDYLRGPFRPLWPTFDVVDSSAAQTNYSARWHLDGGVTNTHKLFIYLNPVAEHGGNTVMVDLESTKKLQQAGELPIVGTERKADLSEVFRDLGIESKLLAYDLGAGDALLFDPLTLAHRCLPPRDGGKRYTICFTIVPHH